jgi:hypothetical protein
MLTVLSNRIGDVALLMVIAWIINFGGWSFIYHLEFLSGLVEIELVSFLVVLAAMTRSAQNSFFFLVAYGSGCSFACFCFSTLFYFGYCRSLFIDLLIRFCTALPDSGKSGEPQEN